MNDLEERCNMTLLVFSYDAYTNATIFNPDINRCDSLFQYERTNITYNDLRIEKSKNLRIKLNRSS